MPLNSTPPSWQECVASSLTAGGWAPQHPDRPCRCAATMRMQSNRDNYTILSSKHDRKLRQNATMHNSRLSTVEVQHLYIYLENRLSSPQLCRMKNCVTSLCCSFPGHIWGQLLTYYGTSPLFSPANTHFAHLRRGTPRRIQYFMTPCSRNQKGVPSRARSQRWPIVEVKASKTNKREIRNHPRLSTPLPALPTYQPIRSCRQLISHIRKGHRLVREREPACCRLALPPCPSALAVTASTA
ncbi:hypothetical protein B0T19DRAFT_8451 [Cercophora scortea]|uniref:Uncharacterized protein n=1 Tax=Cercophora scortea TaxID=314031 RepID=A0AAE0J204_9PEZI|nr:hypothetical protein B0T19DRAFT_8451 [Cercophora scortea]